MEFPYIREVYRLYGAEDKVANVHLTAEGHSYGLSKRLAAYPFLAKQLGLSPDRIKNEEGEITETNIEIEPRERFKVFDEAHPLPKDALRGE